LGPYQVPYSNSAWNGGGLALDSNNSVWITDTTMGRLLAFNQTSKQWLALNQTASPAVPYLSTPNGSADLNAVTVDRHGNVWYVGDTVAPPNSNGGGHGGGGIGKIEMYNRTSRIIKNFVPGSTSADRSNSTLLTDVQVAPDGTIWFAEHGTNRLGKIIAPYTDNSSITQISLDSVNAGAFPWGLKVDSQGNIWFSEHIGNKIGFYNVASNQFMEYAIPTPESDSKFPALDQYGNVWFAEGNSPAGQSTNLGVLALQPSAIGLGPRGPDYYYEYTVVALAVSVAAVSLRWQRLVRFFSRRRRGSKEATKKTVKLQSQNKGAR
jgi:streptogramin lyase